MKMIANSKHKTLVYLLFLLSFVSIFSIIRSDVVFSQGYNDNRSYGECAYGEPCPTEVTDPIDPEETPDPDNPEPGDPPPEIPEEETNPPIGGPTTTTTTPPTLGSAEQDNRQFNFPFIEVVRALPTPQQRLLPYYFYVFLLIYAIILFIQAVLDKRKTYQIQKMSQKLSDIMTTQKTFLRVVTHYLRTPIEVIKSGVELLKTKHPTMPLASVQAAALGLAGVINQISLILEQSDDEISQTNSEANLVRKNIFHWYFLIPVVCVLCIVIYANFLLFKVESEAFSTTYLAIQVIVYVLAFLILLNAIRYMRLSKINKKLMISHVDQQNKLQHERAFALKEISTTIARDTKSFSDVAKAIPDGSTKNIIMNGTNQLDSMVGTVSIAATLPDQNLGECVIAGFVTKAIGENEQAISEKHIHITTDIKVAPFNSLYHEHYEFICSELVSNAVKFNNDQGTIHVQAQVKNKILYLQVDDSGEGIDEHAKKQLLKPFSRTDDALQFDTEGIGLGLYAINAIVKNLEGTIDIDSHEGGGSSIKIAMPVR